MSAAQPFDSIPGSSLSLDEVSVTAIKQSESLLRQPVAVTTIDQGEIERLNISGMKGVSGIAPNFYMPEYGSRMTSSIYVRGIGARIDQAAVGLNVDNIPFLNKNGFDFDMMDVERIEVLRGPQSTLYGRNTIAGLINVYTLSPMSWQGVRVMAEGSLPSGWRGGVGAYGKLSPRMAMSVNVYGAHARGIVRNRHNGQWDGGTDDLSGRWRTQWRPSARMSVENTFSASRSRQHGYPYAFAETGVVDYNDTCFYRRTAFTDGLTLRWSGDNISVSSITGLQWLQDNMTLDQDFLPDPYFTMTQRQIDRSITQDIVVRGHTGRYSWLAGVFGFYKHNRMSAPVNFRKVGIDSIIGANIPAGMALSFKDDAFTLGSDFRAPVKGFAVYHRSTLDLGPWTLSASVRFDYERTTLNYRSRLDTEVTMSRQVAPGVFVPIATRPVNIDDRDRLDNTFREVLPNFSVTYNMSNSAVYATVAKGYKAGGFNTQMFSTVLQNKMQGMFAPSASTPPSVAEAVGYKPEVSWNYEAGGHFTCDDGRVYSTLSAFFIDVRDQQVTVFPDGNIGGRMMANAGRTRSFGAELSLRYAPVSRWCFDLSYGYTNATFRHFFDGEKNLSGNRVPYAPSNTLFLSALYRLPLSCSWTDALTFNPTLRGTGSIWWDEENTLRQPFYAELGAIVRLEKGDFSFELWGRNLTDTRFTVFSYESIGHNFLQRGRGINGGITLRMAI